MRCEEVRELIPQCVGHDISPEEETAVHQHTAACPECAHELKEYRLIASTLTQLKEGEAPAGTWETMWSAIRQRTTGTPRVLSFNLDVVLRVAAVALIGVGLGFFGSLILTRDEAGVDRTLVADSGNHEGIVDPDLAGGTPVKNGKEVEPKATRPLSIYKNLFRAPVKNNETYYLPSSEIVVPVKGGEVKF